MPGFMFNWSIMGSTVIDAPTKEEAQKQFDAIKTNVELVAGADAATFAQHEVMQKSPAGFFELEV